VSEVSPAATQGPNPETYAIEVLNHRPAPPVGRVDISDLRAAAMEEENPTDAAGWSMGRGVLWADETAEPLARVGNIPKIVIDTTASLPIFGETTRGMQFDRAGAHARQMVRELFGTEKTGQLGEEAPGLQPLAHAMNRDQTARQLLEAGIWESLYQITLDEAAGTSDTNPIYEQNLHSRLAAQTVTYVDARLAAESDEPLAETPKVERGPLLTQVTDEQTYLEHLAALPIPTLAAREARRLLQKGSNNPLHRETARETEPAGDTLAESLIAWQAAQIAKQVVGNEEFQPTRIVTTDVADPRDIALSSIVHTPQATQELDVFSRAVQSLFDPNSHFVSNFFDELPFPDGSVALITSFVGYPGYFLTDDREGRSFDLDQTRQSVTNNLTAYYRKLAYGGKMLFFPWSRLSPRNTHLPPDEQLMMREGERAINDMLREGAAEFAAQHGISFDLRCIHLKTLRDWMSPSDREISADDRLPILDATKGSHIEVLIVSKPRESSVRAHNTWLSRMAVESQTAEEPTA
jgi:hypothetical protein